MMANTTVFIVLIVIIFMSQVWKRSEITSCSCSEKPYRHVHCPCARCVGRAVDRKTELRHWNESKVSAKKLKQLDAFREPLSKCNLALPEDLDLEEDEEQTDDGIDIQCDSSEGGVIDESESSFDNQPFDPACAGCSFNLLEDTAEFDNDMQCDSSEGGVVDEESEPSFDSQPSVQKESETNPLRTLVVNAVLNALKIVKESGSSCKTFEDILDYGKTLLLASYNSENIDREIVLTLWPNNWNSVQKLLKEEGYEDAKLLYICFCCYEKEKVRNGKTTKTLSYTGKYSVFEDKNDVCIHCGKRPYLKYYYLGLSTKVKNWFKSVEMCQRMLSHWEERGHWLGQESSYPEKCEFWDGERWVELQWFWDPTKTWIVPTICPHCELPVSSEHLINSPDVNDVKKNVECPNCFEVFEHCVKVANGSPLNLALIGHWDGFQPFGSSYRGCGSLEVSVANLAKKDRNHVEEVYVVGFVPCHQVPNIPEALDPFLEPLMQDLAKGFIDGYQVCDYPTEIEVQGYQPSENEIVRVLLLCWTADHPGQCECGKFLNQGRCGCRRCKLIGKVLENSTNTHVYYGENRYHYRYPWEVRSIETSIADMFDIENESRVTVRKAMSSNKGFTGTSVLHKYLYPLYGFDILKHTVYDVFHTICLNVVKNQLERLLDLRLIDPAYFDDQIEKFPYTKELKSGRIPHAIGKCKSLGQWKAEGLKKFSFPMADCIFMEKLDSQELEIQSLVSRLTELHFYSGRNSWNDDMIEMHRQLAWRLNILIEEVQGLHMCTISIHNLTHIHEDILNFGSPDNYWCAVYERAVRQYIKKSHNCKGIEGTFAQSEARREFLKPLYSAVQLPKTGKLDINTGFASSAEVANTECQKQAPSRISFLVGSMTNVKSLHLNDRIAISNTLHVSLNDIPSVSFVSNNAFLLKMGFHGSVVSHGEAAIVDISGHEKVLKIHNFFSMTCQGTHFATLMVFGHEYQALTLENGDQARDFWSGFVKVKTNPIVKGLFYPLECIKRKVILYRCNDNVLCVADYQRELRQLPYHILVPVYIEIGDMLLIQGELLHDIWYGHAQSVNYVQRTVDVYFFVKSARNQDLYRRESQGRHSRNTVSWKSVVGLASGKWISNMLWKKD